MKRKIVYGFVIVMLLASLVVSLYRAYSPTYGEWTVTDEWIIGPDWIISGIDVVTVAISSPSNITYTSGTITVSFTASGGTIDKQWWSCSNETTLIYSNVSYTGSTSITLTSEVYILHCYANNTLGDEGSSSVVFTVSTSGGGDGGGSSYTVTILVVSGKVPQANNTVVYFDTYSRQTDKNGAVVFTTTITGNHTIKIYVSNRFVKQQSIYVTKTMTITIDIAGYNPLNPMEWSWLPAWVRRYALLIGLAIVIFIIALAVVIGSKLIRRKENWVR